jgi:hypothetical protein
MLHGAGAGGPHHDLVRKRPLPVEIEGPLPTPGMPFMAGDEEGEMRRGADGLGLGLALLRLERLDAGLRCGDSRLRPRRSAWANL